MHIDELLRVARPLDLLVFRGDDLIANTIALGQFLATGGANAAKVNHVGIVMNHACCPDAKIDQSKLYIWESTLSGDDGVPDAETGRPRLGVQFRDLEQAVRNYKGRVGLCRLRNYPTIDKAQISELYHRLNHESYTGNPLDLLGAVFPALRKLRDKSIEYLEDHSIQAERWLFCSEFVATVYIATGIITDPKIKPRDVVPSDFISRDLDDMPRVVDDPEWIEK